MSKMVVKANDVRQVEHFCSQVVLKMQYDCNTIVKLLYIMVTE